MRHTMHDHSVLSPDEIEAKCQEAEHHLAALLRLQAQLGPLGIEEERVRLWLRDLRRDYCGR